MGEREEPRVREARRLSSGAAKCLALRLFWQAAATCIAAKTVAPALLVAHAPDDTGKRVVDMSSEGIASTHSTGPLLQCRRDTNRSSARNIGTGAQSGRRTRTRVVRVRDQAAGPVL